MVRLTYNHYSPPLQALRAIDLSTEVRFARVIDKQDGDRTFTANEVVNHFGEFQDVKRNTHDDWETLPRYPAEIQSDGTETLEAFPAYTDDVLYVAKQGLTPRTPGVTPIKVSDDGGMESFPDPSLQEDFSSHSFYDSDSYNSNYNTMHSMADRWTLNLLNKDVRLQPLFFVLPRGPLPSTDKNDPSAVQLTMYLLCVNHHRTEHDSVPHFTGVPGVAVKRPAEFLQRFSATLLWGLKTLKDSLRALETGLGDGQAGYAQITTLLQSELGLSSADDVKQLVDKMIDYLQGAQYIMDHVGAHGDYDAQKGSITLRPQDSEDLQQLCLLDAAMVGCVTELIIDVSWDASTEDVQSIHALAGRLGFTGLTITTTAIASSDSTSALSSPMSSLSGESSGSQLEKIKELSHALLQGLKHLCISSHVALNAPALLFDLGQLSPRKNVLVVTVKEPSSRCLAGLYNGNTQLLDLRTTLDHAKNITTTGYFAGNLQSLTITVLESLRMESPHLVLSLLTDAITTILRKNPNLSLLTLYCDARDFRMMEAMMESIYSKMTSDQAPDSRLSIYTLIDNSEDHLVATFKLPNSRDNKAVVANVTTRKNGSGHDAFLDEYGQFVRTLNTNDKFRASAIDALHRSITRKRSSQLRNVTISVGDLDPKGAVTFLNMLKSSDGTLKQLVLVGSPVDYRVYISVMDALRSLSSVEVVRFDDGSNMRQWIDDVQDSLLEGSSLSVLDRVDDLRRIVPGHDDTSLDWLRIRQAIHFNTGAASQDASATSRLPSISSPVEVQQGHRLTEDQQLLRALDNPKSTIDTTASATDEIHARGEFEVLEDKSRLISFKKVTTKLSQTFKPKQGLISSEGYRSVANTSSKPLSPAITKALSRFLYMLAQLNEMHREHAASKGRGERMLQKLTESKVMEEQMQEMQQETINRLIMTQQQVDAILNQNYELHEYPVPRLFVILPYSSEERDLRNLTVEQFRLFFLCECGDDCQPGARHETSSDQIDNTAAASATTILLNNGIHLAKHEGYELSRPTEFFDQYGPYVLAMLRVLKHRLVVAVALAGNGLKGIVDGVKPISERTIEAVDRSINFLETKLRDTDAADGLVTTASTEQEDHAMFENPAALEGADLRQLDTFLRKNDNDKILGNLYRITTERGHVKWVCFDHYKETYRHDALSPLLECVAAVGGTYNRHLAQVTVALKSSIMSKDFCRSFASQAVNVQILNVTLDWSTSSTDLRNLREAVRRSSVSFLVLDLCNKASTKLDALTFSSRSEPIVQIMASPRIHTMILKNTTGFLSQTKRLLKTALYIRHFDLGEMITSIDEVVKLEKLIRVSLSLTDLSCRASNIDLVLDHIVFALKDTRRPRNLNLCIQTRHSEATVKFEGNTGGILSINLQVQSMTETRYFNHRMIKSIHIQGSHELSTLLDRFGRCLKNYAKLESVWIECSSDYHRGWFVAFQTLFAQYPHQTPRFSISNNKSTITTGNIQDSESIEEVEEVEEHQDDDNTESPAEPEP
ncbi:hypothetical protein BGX30_011858 [Mortierella sp. GBA39]|nr:hypothetical protein BGX30_011858 [Mortierella sp. GBA39]